MWPSKIKLIYLGNATSCELNSGTWLEDEVHKTNGTSDLVNTGSGKALRNIDLNKILDVSA